MNIQDPMSTDASVQAPPEDSSTSTESAHKKDKERDKDVKSFAKVLAEKSKSAGAKTDAGPTSQPQNFRETAPITQQAKQISPAALPPAMQNLVQEITVAAGPQNQAKVDIQLNSKTFDGLKISITHGTDGNVSIQMLSRTPEVAAVLNRNVDQLSQALAARGVPVESIRVQTVTASASARSDARGGDARGGNSGQSNKSGRQT